MKAKNIVLIAAIAIVALIALNSAYFTLSEGECAVVQRFGRIHGMYVKEVTPELQEQLDMDGNEVTVYTGTGLKFKVPFIDNVITYSSKLISYETPTRDVTTADKRKLYFDNSAQWRIINPYRFYKAFNSIPTAKNRIDNILYSSMNDRVGSIISHALITDKNASGEMLALLTENVNEQMTAYGISVVDIRIKRTDLPPENYDSIYNRMNTERNRIAAQYRSEGEEESLKVRSDTDRQVITITSEAFKQAETAKGEGDSEAARIFNAAYSKNPEFFEFYNLLNTYKATLDNKSTLVVPLDSPFAKYLLGVNNNALNSVTP